MTASLTSMREWQDPRATVQTSAGRADETLVEAKHRASLVTSYGTGTRSDSDIPSRDNTSPLPIAMRQRNPAVLLAEWNGCVSSVEDYYFTAELTGIVGDGITGEQEDAEIPLSDVAPSDSELLRPGNFFRLCVFYETQEDGRPRRYTQLVFRRLPAYRAHDLAQAMERARERHNALRVE